MRYALVIWAAVAATLSFAAIALGGSPAARERCVLTYRADGVLTSRCVGPAARGTYELRLSGPPRCVARPSSCAIREIYVGIR